MRMLFAAGLAAAVVARAGEEKAVPAALAFTVKSIDGQDVPLSKYAGKVVLVVNVASRCGYTPQYEGLQKLHEQHKAQGLAVLGFPANEFGAQEPGTDAEIKAFCTGRYHVDFDMFAKVVVKGAGQVPFFQHLTANANPKGDIRWNFEKFLIGRDGTIVGRFGSGVAPDAPELVAAIEKALAAKP